MMLVEVATIRSTCRWCLLPATLIFLELIVGRWEQRQTIHKFASKYGAHVDRTRKWLCAACYEPVLNQALLKNSER